MGSVTGIRIRCILADIIPCHLTLLLIKVISVDIIYIAITI